MTPLETPSIELLRAQDHAAFEALSERHYVPIRRYLTRLAGDSEVAAELTQETFLRAYQAMPRLADDSDVQGWLYRIATNLARQHYRHGRLIHWRTLEPHHALSQSLADDVARQDLVRRALDRLSLDQRACLMLYAWTGYTCAEIGEIMDRTPEAVRMLLVRARRRFRELYDDLERDGDGLPDVDGAPRKDQPTPYCAGRDETLPRYLRGDLPRGTFKKVTKHLEECHDCRVALQAEQALNRLVQRCIALSFTPPRAAWHASAVLVKRRPQTQQGELDGSTQVVGIQVRRQVREVRKVRKVGEINEVSHVGAQVERQVR